MKATRVVLNERKLERKAEKALERKQAAAEAEAMDTDDDERKVA